MSCEEEEDITYRRTTEAQIISSSLRTIKQNVMSGRRSKGVTVILTTRGINKLTDDMDLSNH